MSQIMHGNKANFINKENYAKHESERMAYYKRGTKELTTIPYLTTNYPIIKISTVIEYLLYSSGNPDFISCATIFDHLDHLKFPEWSKRRIKSHMKNYGYVPFKMEQKCIYCNYGDFITKNTLLFRLNVKRLNNRKHAHWYEIW